MGRPGDFEVINHRQVIYGPPPEEAKDRWWRRSPLRGRRARYLAPLPAWMPPRNPGRLTFIAAKASPFAAS